MRAGSFSKANVTALAATLVDFSTLIGLVQLFRVYYVIATAIGACLGAVTNFTLNQLWAFSDAQKRELRHAAWRYALVSATSAALNTGGVFFFARFLGFQYILAKIVTAITVGWAWNYPLHRHFVWPKPAQSAHGKNQEALHVPPPVL